MCMNAPVINVYICPIVNGNDFIGFSSTDIIAKGIIQFIDVLYMFALNVPPFSFNIHLISCNYKYGNCVESEIFEW